MKNDKKRFYEAESKTQVCLGSAEAKKRSDEIQLFRQALQRQNERAARMKMPEDMEQRVMRSIKPKSAIHRWRYPAIVAVAASIAMLITFHYYNKEGPEQQPVMAETTELNNPLPAPQPIIEEKKEETLAEVQPKEKPVKKQRPVQINKEQQLANADAPSVDSFDYYIARLEAEMAALDDSVSTAQLEKLINADARLRQLVNRIINGEVEQAQNILRPDSTAEYPNF